MKTLLALVLFAPLSLQPDLALAQEKASPPTQEVFGQLPREKQGVALKIVEESLPQIRCISDKMNITLQELTSLTYSTNLTPEDLPQLGLEYQTLRKQLLDTLTAVNIRLQREVGVKLQVPEGRGAKSMNGLCKDVSKNIGDTPPSN